MKYIFLLIIITSSLSAQAARLICSFSEGEVEDFTHNKLEFGVYFQDNEGVIETFYTLPDYPFSDYSASGSAKFSPDEISVDAKINRSAHTYFIFNRKSLDFRVNRVPGSKKNFLGLGFGDQEKVVARGICKAYDIQAYKNRVEKIKQRIWLKERKAYKGNLI